MKTKIIEMARRMRGALCLFTALMFAMGAARPASAQWTVADAANAWTSFNNHFYNTDSSGRGYYYEVEGSTTEEFFWTLAEEIEMAEDAEFWDQANAPGNVTADKNRVLNLINGFRHLHGDDWSSDPYDDDLSVAALAFVRCWEETGSGVCLSDAENNFNTVYSRGYDTTFGGGLWWNYTDHTSPTAGKSSSANWTFAIVGRLLYAATGNTSYKTKADSIFNWAVATLYDSSNGQVYNSIQNNGLNKGAVSYNFGLAIGAAYEEGNSTLTNNMANYLINDVYAAIVNGYGILPNYGNSNNGFGAFNGMTFRWMGASNLHGYMPSKFVPWAQQNISLGWADRNAEELSWDDWVPDPPASTSPATPISGLYSIGCTAMPIGMFYVPAP
jgi:hypothetical protein